MPVVAAAITPHSPVLVPSVAKQHAAALSSTRESLSHLAADFYARQVDTLILLTPHGPQVADHLTINVSDQYQGDLLRFGDAVTRLAVRGSLDAVQRLQDLSAQHGVGINLVTEPKLDYGCVVPLTFFGEVLEHATIVPITISHTSRSGATLIGLVLEEFFHQSQQRVGIIASADLFRRQKAQPRLLPEERTIGQAIAAVDPGPVLNIDATGGVCGLPPILILLSSLHRIAHHGRTLAFEAPLGVGQMTAQIDLPS